MTAIIKLVIAALVIHAAWRAATVYLRHYEFKEEVTQIAQFGVDVPNNVIHNHVLDAAKRLDVPVESDSVTVQRRQAHILIDANYTEQVEILPRYFYPWQAKMHVDVPTLVLQEAR
jgi:hypothetical protein